MFTNQHKTFVINTSTAFSVALLVSIALLCVGTIPAVAADPYLRAVFFVLNFISILIFSAELAIDCIVFRGPWSALVLEPVFIIDFLAIFPFYLEVLIAIVLGHDIITSVGSVSGLAVLRVLRLFRILRLLKVVERSEKLRLLGTAVLASSDGIAVLFLVSPLLVCFFGTLTFYAEQTDEYFKDGVWYYSDGTVSPFQSIPDCFWLTIVTLTTVGYGDVAPRTTAGRLVSAANALIALIFLAFPLTIITSQYSKLITDAEARAKRKKEKKAAAAKSAAAFTEQVRRGSGVLPPSAPFSVDEAAEILMELDKLRSRLAKIVGRPEDVQF
ncbi:hypothetical protein DFJ73DRAFT_844556 [Zopfochytrium polystomum]|nr:hypothetical protein DFJ73DRAFT_844556 [Zopfochytrium polystomum]